MEVYLQKKNSDSIIQITDFITSVTISGEYRSCARMADFGVVQNQGDVRTSVLQMEAGDKIRITEGEEELFQGIIWSKSKTSHSSEINFTAYDYGIYLKKNKASYTFRNLTPQAIAQKVCSDFAIETGTLAGAGQTISRTFFNVSLYDIIMSAYTLASDKKYLCYFAGRKLMVAEKGTVEVTPLQSGVNIQSSTVSESLESMINRVRVYNKEDTLIKEETNAEDLADYGAVTAVLRMSDDQEDLEKKIAQTLQGVERKITVTNFGDPSYRTGKKVRVQEPYTGLTGIFYIDEDKHTFQNGLYTNELTLNLENLMYEQESGTEVEA